MIRKIKRNIARLSMREQGIRRIHKNYWFSDNWRDYANKYLRRFYPRRGA